MPIKQSIDQYRNIKGKYYIMWTSNPEEFKKCIKEIKSEGLSYRIIDNQLYKQVNKI